MREEIVFGPIHSRRLGSSLGINLLPEKGKLCNFDCIYCECGWNKAGRGDKAIPNAEKLRKALEAKLKDCVKNGVGIDSITFSGDGEPTLNPDFPEIISITIELRDKYFPSAMVSVLSNATRVGKPEVFEALKKVDNPILKLDAPTDELVRKINQPQGDYHVAGWMASVRDLKPREVMVYTLDREAPAEGLEKFTAEEMESLVRPLIEEGINIQIRG